MSIAFKLACEAPWAMAPEALRTLLAVACREGEGPEAVAARLGRPLENTRTVTRRDGVAILPVEGPIFRRANLFTEISGGTSTDVLATDLRAAADDPSVRAILLEIDSPGGEAAGIAELAGMVRESATRKPVASYVDDMGASGAYWLAAASGHVAMSPTAMVGSIGVVMAMRDPSKQASKSIQFVSSQSPNKRPDPTTAAGMAQIQTLVDHTAEVFISDVARFRGVDPKAVIRDFGGGGMKVGAHAVRARMADEVGTFEGLLARLAAGRIAPLGASPSRVTVPVSRGAAMGWQKNVLKALFGGDEEPQSSEPDADETSLAQAAEALRLPAKTPARTPTPDPTQADDLKALKAQVESLRKANADLQAAKVKDDLDATVARLRRSGKLSASEVPLFSVLYREHARTDAAGADPIVFAEGEKSVERTRVESFVALYDARPSSPMFVEAMGDRDLVVRQVDPTASEEEEFDKDVRKAFPPKANGRA